VLVLTRRKGESILVGDKVVVTGLDMSKDRVRLGIEAPIEVRVDRHEVRQRIAAERDRTPTPERATLKPR
jgi:carbon storage regulator